jgi:RNA polymerase sigma-70 factor, ECF subfamily
VQRADTLAVRAGRRAAARSAAATPEALFAAVEGRLGSFLAQLVPDRALADDLLGDVFETAVRRREELVRADDPAAWLFGVARRKALAAHRRRFRARVAFERLVHLRAPAAEESDADTVLAVRDVLSRTVSPDDRALLILRYVHGFDAPALARITGRSPEAVRQRLARASRRVREAWTEEVDE